MHCEVQPAPAIFWGFKIIRDRFPIRCEILHKRNENGWRTEQERDAISKSIHFQWRTRGFFCCCCWLQMTTNSLHLKKFSNCLWPSSTSTFGGAWEARRRKHCSVGRQGGSWVFGHRQNDLICRRLWWTGIKTGSLKAGKGHLASESKGYFIRK